MNLKDCPFCGGKAQIKTTRATMDGPGRVYAKCTDCEAAVESGPDCLWLNESDPVKHQSAADRWNRRK